MVVVTCVVAGAEGPPVVDGAVVVSGVVDGAVVVSGVPAVETAAPTDRSDDDVVVTPSEVDWGPEVGVGAPEVVVEDGVSDVVVPPVLDVVASGLVVGVVAASLSSGEDSSWRAIVEDLTSGPATTGDAPSWRSSRTIESSARATVATWNAVRS